MNYYILHGTENNGLKLILKTHCSFPGCSVFLGAGDTMAGEGAAAAATAGDKGGTSALSLGISTCFQSSPSSTSKPMIVPRRTFLLPSSF